MSEGKMRSIFSSFRIVYDQYQQENNLLKRIGFLLSVGLTLFVTLFPFFMMFITSITPSSQIYSSTPSLIPRSFTLENYVSLINSEIFPFPTYFLNSVIIATVTATFSLLVGIFGAYSFTRLDYPGNSIIRRSVIVVYMLASITVIVPLFLLLSSLGLIDTRLSLFITYIVSTLPLILYMLWNYFQSLPKEIEEAAILDGYSRIEIIFRVVLPLSLPIIVAAFLFAFKIAWNEYIFASVFLKSQSMYTLPIGIEAMNTQFDQVWGQVMAASFITTLPIIVMFLYLEKYMVAGLTSGGVEG